MDLMSLPAGRHTSFMFDVELNYLNKNNNFKVIVPRINMMKKNDTNANDENKATSTSSTEVAAEDIAFEEVIPEDSPPRKNLPERPTIRKPSGKHIPVE